MSGNKEMIIGIVGPTGTGKTSLGQALSDRIGYPFLEELPQDNPFLARYYADIKAGNLPSRWAFHSQVHFLTKAIEQGKKIAKLGGGGAIWDVPPLGHRMYADLAFQAGIMDPDSYRLYGELFQVYMELPSLAHPDVVLVVTTKVQTLKDRINRRAAVSPERAMEQEVNLEYWQAQIKYWESKLSQNDGPLLRVDSGVLDWVNGDGVEAVCEMIAGRNR